MRTLTLVSLLLLAGCGSTVPVRPSATPAALPAPKVVEYLSAESCAKGWGLKFRWEAETRRATVSGPDRELVCCAGMRSALLDGVPVRLEAPAEMRDGRLMIPSGLSSEATRAWALRPAIAPAIEAPKGLPVAPTGPRVVVDAGHGGSLTGAQGAGGSYEKDVNLAIASRLAETLRAEGMDVVVTRDSDRAFYPSSLANGSYHEQQKSDLNERVRLANGARPDLFVSIHANWAPSPDAEGFEVYYPRPPLSEPPPVAVKGKAKRKSPFDHWSAYGNDTANVIRRLSSGDREEDRWKDSRDLAEAVRRAMRSDLSTPDRGARQADHVVTRSSAAPAILVETGFLSSPDEEKRLNSPEYQKRVAQAVAEGVKRYLASHKP